MSVTWMVEILITAAWLAGGRPCCGAQVPALPRSECDTTWIQRIWKDEKGAVCTSTDLLLTYSGFKWGTFCSADSCSCDNILVALQLVLLSVSERERGEGRRDSPSSPFGEEYVDMVLLRLSNSLSV